MRLFQIGVVLIIASFCSPIIHAKTLDLKTHTDIDGGNREISICARPSPDNLGLPGHAFIAFSETTKDGKRSFRAIGHTAFSVGEALLSYTGLVTAEGALVDEKYTSIKQQCLTLQVNKSDYDKAYGVTVQPLKNMGIEFDEAKPIQKAYSLGAEDCVGFLTTQVNFFASKVVVPPRKSGELPLDYIRRFIDSN